MPNKAINFVTSCIIFWLVVAGLSTNFEMLLADPDTAWHLAAGDLIRATGEIPKTDPWAFTSSGVPWINLAWLWDVWMSWLNAQLGWHGQIAFLCVCYAGTMVLLYQACLLRSGNGIASFFAVFFVVLSMPLYLRSMWASNLMLTSVFLLALLIQYRGWSRYWWLTMPAMMPLWVNVHGGFIVAFVILGAFGLQTLLQKQWRQVAFLTLVGLLSIAGLGANPYGYSGVARIVFATFTTPALDFIAEFQPTTLSWSFLLTCLYVPVFLFCAIHQKTRTSLPEAILAFGPILLAATSMRYWNFVFLFSAPVLAQYFAAYMKTDKKRGNELALRLAETFRNTLFVTHARLTCLAAALFMAAGLGVFFSPITTQALGLNGYRPYAIFDRMLAFAQSRYPHARFLTDYSSGGPLISASGGRFPVFIDGRGESAYPYDVVVAYRDMLDAKPGWEKIFDTYQIDGIILSSYNVKSELLHRFDSRRGFHKVFSDSTVVIYMREPE